MDDEIRALQERALADPLLTQEQLSDLLQLSISTLYRLRRSGTGPSWVKVRGAIRYRSSAVARFLEGRDRVDG
jgi:predicted DNA-binding transcriptional regulator AlpA